MKLLPFETLQVWRWPTFFQSQLYAMYVYITGTIAVALVVIAVYVRLVLFVPPKGGVVRVSWKDRHSLPSLSSRLFLILAGALVKKEGRFHPGLKDFPETHIEIGTSEYVGKNGFSKVDLCAFNF